jgi:hypothetical protein
LLLILPTAPCGFALGHDEARALPLVTVARDGDHRARRRAVTYPVCRSMTGLPPYLPRFIGSLKGKTFLSAFTSKQREEQNYYISE